MKTNKVIVSVLAPIGAVAGFIALLSIVVRAGEPTANIASVVATIAGTVLTTILVVGGLYLACLPDDRAAK